MTTRPEEDTLPPPELICGLCGAPIGAAATMAAAPLLSDKQIEWIAAEKSPDLHNNTFRDERIAFARAIEAAAQAHFDPALAEHVQKDLDYREVMRRHAEAAEHTLAERDVEIKELTEEVKGLQDRLAYIVGEVKAKNGPIRFTGNDDN